MSPERPETAGDVAQRIIEKLARARSAGQWEDVDGTDRLLQQRARELARETPPPAAETLLEIVEFAIGPQRFAFEGGWVREVIRPRQLQLLPTAPPFIAGLTVLGGVILPVLDLRQLFRLPETEPSGAHLVLFLAREESKLGILAERIEGYMEIPRERLAPAPAALSGALRQYLRGLLPGGIPLLDAHLLLAMPLLEFEGVSASPAEGGSS